MTHDKVYAYVWEKVNADYDDWVADMVNDIYDVVVECQNLRKQIKRMKDNNKEQFKKHIKEKGKLQKENIKWREAYCDIQQRIKDMKEMYFQNEELQRNENDELKREIKDKDYKIEELQKLLDEGYEVIQRHQKKYDKLRKVNMTHLTALMNLNIKARGAYEVLETLGAVYDEEKQEWKQE